MSTEFTDRVRADDVLKWEVEQRFCRNSVQIKNTSAGAVIAGEIRPGALLRNNGGTWETLLNANVGDVDGIVIDSRPVEAIAAGATSVKSYQILVRGPALVNLSQIPLVDLNDVTYTSATLIAALKALGIQFLEEAATVETQTY